MREDKPPNLYSLERCHIDSAAEVNAGIDARVSFSSAAPEKLENDRVMPANGGPLIVVNAMSS